jgi:multimeric flavodoxin WrbA
MGQPSSVAKRAMERMDAFLEETDDEGRMVSYGRVAAVAVVGNEDGAHHVSAEVYQALNDVGFTIPANAVAYWVGEAMGSVNFVDLDAVPKWSRRQSICWRAIQCTSRDCSVKANIPVTCHEDYGF